MALNAIDVLTYGERKYVFRGTGNVEQCIVDVEPLLNKDVKPCASEFCSINGIQQPPIPSDALFYGISEYWYSFYDVLNLRGIYNHQKTQQAAEVTIV